MNKKLIILIIFICLLFVGIYSYIQKKFTFDESTYLKPPITFSDEKLWKLINEYRKDNGLQEWTLDQRLCDFAQIRAKESSIHFRHDEFNNYLGKFERYCPECSFMNENLSVSHSEEHTLSGWIHSPGHKRLLDSDFHIGCVRSVLEHGSVYTSLIVGKL